MQKVIFALLLTTALFTSDKSYALTNEEKQDFIQEIAALDDNAFIEVIVDHWSELRNELSELGTKELRKIETSRGEARGSSRAYGRAGSLLLLGGGSYSSRGTLRGSSREDTILESGEHFVIAPGLNSKEVEKIASVNETIEQYQQDSSVYITKFTLERVARLNKVQSSALTPEQMATLQDSIELFRLAVVESQERFFDNIPVNRVDKLNQVLLWAADSTVSYQHYGKSIETFSLFKFNTLGENFWGCTSKVTPEVSTIVSVAGRHPFYGYLALPAYSSESVVFESNKITLNGKRICVDADYLKFVKATLDKHVRGFFINPSTTEPAYIY